MLCNDGSISESDSHILCSAPCESTAYVSLSLCVCVYMCACAVIVSRNYECVFVKSRESLFMLSRGQCCVMQFQYVEQCEQMHRLWELPIMHDKRRKG